MGKGEWRTRRPGSELPKEPHKEPHDALRQMQHRVEVGTHDQVQVLSNLEMAMKLSSRSECDPKAANELNRRTKGVSFNKIGGYRHRGASDLIGQAEVTTEGRAQSEAVRRTRELISALPRFEGLQLSHRDRIIGRGTEGGVIALQVGTKVRRPIPFPLPHSPFPVV